jgi:negative regulator of sigma E activity
LVKPLIVVSCFIAFCTLQQAKAKAALDQAAEAQKTVATAGKKIRMLEDEIDEIRAKHRQTPEVALIQQLAEVKGQLADSERRCEMVKAEKAEILLEKEQFRASVNRLVSLNFAK